MHIKGTMNSGAVITTDTPVAEWDDSTTASVTYIRYEIVDNDTKQYLERIDERTTTSRKLERTKATWNNRVTASYVPINA